MFVCETIIPSAEPQILSESRQIRQRNGKSCQNHGKSVSGIANSVEITANPSAESQILSELRQIRQRNRKSIRKMTLQTAKLQKQAKKGLFLRFCRSAYGNAGQSSRFLYFELNIKDFNKFLFT